MASMSVVIVATLGVLFGDVASPETSAVSVTARVVDTNGAPVQQVRLADKLVLEVTVSGPPGVAFFPPFRPAVGTFELLPSRPPEQRPDGQVWFYDLLAVRTGVERIPPIEIPHRLADGTEATVSTPLLRVDVRGYLENEQDPKLAPPPSPVPVITTDWALIWGLSVLGTLLVAGLLAFFVLKALESRFRAAAPPPPPRPAIDVALERLAAVDADDGLDGSARHAALIDILRGYLAGRYGFDALEMTSRETMTAVSNVDLKNIPGDDIARLLDEADLIKFANFRFDDTTARGRAPLIRHIVTETWEPPEVEEVDDVPKLEAATLRQRFMAGGVDVIMALFPGIVTFGLVWAGGLLEFGWVAFVATGLVFALRDIFGRSLGKRLLGLSLVMRDERQSPAEVGARWSRNTLLFLWPLTLPLEALTLRQHPLRTRIGDLIANTHVVQGERNFPAKHVRRNP